MKKKIKVYVVGPQKNYANFLDDFELVDNIEDAKIVIFTGGEDVTPSLYGAKQHESTFCNKERDMFEIKEFNRIKKSQLVVGICRGSQFLCVMNGGKLVQDITGHCLYDTHEIYNNDGVQLEITSTHHQMQYPFELNRKDYDILYAARRSRRYLGDKIDIAKITCDPEIVLYHKTDMPKCLAIQGHPEYMRHDSPIVQEINNIVKSLIK